MFISFDGLDGVGKSTQIRLLCDWLTGRGLEVATCRDPGTTQLGEALRDIILAGSAGATGTRCEMLLYMAARAQLVEEFIAPTLAAGKVVVSDRFLLSNVVYQGYGSGLDVDALWQIGSIACNELLPTVSIVLDMDQQQAAARLNRPLDRMESRGGEFRERIRQGFLAEARKRPAEIIVVPADLPVPEVHAQIIAAIESRLD